MTARIVACCCFLLAAAIAFAADDGTPEDHPTIAQIVKGGGCAPKDNTARVLKSANPLDNAPNWTGATYIGLAWTFMPKRLRGYRHRRRHLSGGQSDHDPRRPHAG